MASYKQRAKFPDITITVSFLDVLRKIHHYFLLVSPPQKKSVKSAFDDVTKGSHTPLMSLADPLTRGLHLAGDFSLTRRL